MFPENRSRLAGATVVLAVLAIAWIVHVRHPQFLWAAAGVGLAWVAMELTARKARREHDALASLLAERTVERDQQQQARAELQRELDRQTTHDKLTGVWNRAAIPEHLEREMVRAQRDVKVLAVVIADLDHFRKINDTRGNLCGDRVLRTAAERLAFCLREYDSIGRYGGEEFLILIPGYDPAEGRSRLDELVRSVHDHRFLND
ncbi:MAG TPA: GGDEF domain-containing protein, partial [Acidobacteriaceae bacterium]|nr:GGDEF domain-containing protein [Acidobacteriaceae bacterium]